MKKYKYIVASLMATLFVNTGCSDSFLEVSSPTDETVNTYFTTDKHIQEAVVAAYDPLHWSDWAFDEYNPVNMMSDIMADDMWVGGDSKTDNQAWHLMMNFESIPSNVIFGLWKCAYSGVKRCNDVITYLDWATDVTDKNRTYYKAQAIALRVYYYNWVWKFWGNVPYFDTNLTSPYTAEQLTADQLYEKMITSLEEVISMDAFPMRESSSNYGRVTKAMVYMLYTEIVMYQNDETRFPTALKYMKEIIDAPEYDLVANYGDIFKESGEWSKESIFEINYKDDNAVRDWGSPLVAGGTPLPTLISPYIWPDGTDNHNRGWGFGPIRQETYDRYANNDTRRDATCWNAQAALDAYNATNPKDKLSYTKRYQDTGFFLEKYAAITGNNKDQKASSELNWNNNLRVYRYSETLLNAAELIVRSAGQGDAKGYLNQVRKRAGLVTTIEPTIDNIIEERHLEFVGEGKRYWDLIRTGKAASVLVPDSYGYRTNTWSASKKYLPIPQKEIDAAKGTLVQNNY